MEITSHFGGRARIRSEKFKNGSVAASVREDLAAAPGIEKIEVNSRVGSLLVFYSESVTDLNSISELIAKSLDAEADPMSAAPSTNDNTMCRPLFPKRLKRNITNIGMLAALLLSMIGAVFHFKKLHVLTGIIFLALFGDHFYERRELLFG